MGPPAEAAHPAPPRATATPHAPKSTGGLSANISTPWMSKPTTHATTSLHFTRNTSRHARSMRGETDWLAGPRGYAATPRGLAVAQPTTTSRHPPDQGAPDHCGHHDMGGDTSHTATPKPTHRNPNEGSGKPPTASGPQAMAQMAHRKRLLLAHTERLTNPTARQYLLNLIHSNAVHDQDVLRPTLQPTQPPNSTHRHPRHHHHAAEEQSPQDPCTTGSRDTPQPPASRPGDHPAQPKPAPTTVQHGHIDVDAPDLESPPR